MQTEKTRSQKQRSKDRQKNTSRQTKIDRQTEKHIIQTNKQRQAEEKAQKRQRNKVGVYVFCLISARLQKRFCGD